MTPSRAKAAWWAARQATSIPNVNTVVLPSSRPSTGGWLLAATAQTFCKQESGPDWGAGPKFPNKDTARPDTESAGSHSVLRDHHVSRSERSTAREPTPKLNVRGRGHCRQDVPPSWVALPRSILNAQQDLQRRLRIPQDACDGRLVIGGRGAERPIRRIDNGHEPRLDADDTVPAPLDGCLNPARRRAPDRTPSAPAVVHRLSAARARVWAGSWSNELVHGSSHRGNVVSK